MLFGMGGLNMILATLVSQKLAGCLLNLTGRLVAEAPEGATGKCYRPRTGRHAPSCVRD